jgi:hypothetical protein
MKKRFANTVKTPEVPFCITTIPQLFVLRHRTPHGGSVDFGASHSRGISVSTNHTIAHEVSTAAICMTRCKIELPCCSCRATGGEAKKLKCGEQHIFLGQASNSTVRSLTSTYMIGPSQDHDDGLAVRQTRSDYCPLSPEWKMEAQLAITHLPQPLLRLLK